MNLAELKRLTAGTLTTVQPERFWPTVARLIAIAEATQAYLESVSGGDSEVFDPERLVNAMIAEHQMAVALAALEDLA